MKESTKEYERFKFYPGNRPIDKRNLEQLVSSISERNLLKERPIIINENNEVLDGQHRLEAAKQLQIPIFFERKEGGNYQDIIALNGAQKNWKPIDYLNLFAHGEKRESYLKFDKFMKENQLKYAEASLIIHGPFKEMDEFRRFKSGDFIYPEDEEVINSEMKKIHQVWAIIKNHGIKPFHRFRSTAFLRPLLIFIENKNVNWELFLQKIEANWYKIGTRPSTSLYLEMFCEIYNIRNQNKIFMENIGKNSI